jgi:hypothetical protein
MSQAYQQLERLQTEATAFSRSNRRVEANNLYVEGKRAGTTPEQAFASALEANPEVYAEYRDRHNATALIAQLQKAGVRIG